MISGQFRTFGMFFTHAFSWFSFYAFWEWQHPWIFDGSLFTGAFHQNIGSWSNISFSAFSPLCQSHSFVTLYKLSAVSQSDKVLISNFWRFDIKLHLRHSSTSTIFLWSQMSIKISLLKFELHGIPFKRMVLTRFKSKISLIWKMCSKVFEPQGSGRDQIIFSYRVPQKKPSLSEISCGKYYSGWREFIWSILDISRCVARYNHISETLIVITKHRKNCECCPVSQLIVR